MIRKVYVKTLEELSKIIFEQNYNKNINRNRSSFLYRGMPDKKFKLTTSLQRNCKNKKNSLEKAILRNFTKYAANSNPVLENSVWQQLIIGQHHGLPTRLLDWTYSPLMGLHFATSGEELSQMDSHDAVLWKIDIDEINSLLPDRYIEKLKQENAYLFTANMLEFLVDNLEQYDCDMLSNSMVLLEPPSIDQRIINQYSYFSVIPKQIEDIEDFLDRATFNTEKYYIDRNLKWRVRDMLDQMNINERIAYPGLDGLSAWIKRHYYVR